MIRRSIVAISLLSITVTAAGASAPRASVETKPIAAMAAQYGHSFDLPAPPANQTPEQRARWITDRRPALGRTPKEWIAWANQTFALAPSTSSAGVTDLAGAVLHLYSVMGLSDTTALRATLSTRAARVPAQIRDAFGSLVQTVADAYAAQLPVARAVNDRLARGFDPHSPALTIDERDAMSLREATILRAINLFRGRTAGLFAQAATPAAGGADPPMFADPEGLVILGGTGNGTYSHGGLFGDPVLLVDPSGDDLYQNSAGGACPMNQPFTPGGTIMKCNGLVLSVLADLGTASNDVYTYSGVPAAVQGAGGPGAIGMLIDVGGNDRYTSTMTRGTTPANSLAPYLDGGGQGFGFAGGGLLLDGAGNDVYRFDVKSSNGNSIWALGQGFGGAGGLGIASDRSGTDQWLSDGLGLTGPGFEGVYTDGVGFYGGVGILTDTGAGNDSYHSVDKADNVDYYAMGFAAFGGLGVLFDDGGNDYYYSLEQALAVNPAIDPILNCAYGSASLGGVAVMLDAGGNDTYYGRSISTKGAWVMDNGFGGPGVGYGAFVDSSGDDHYTMIAQGSYHMITGRGLYDTSAGLPGENTWGTFVDAGGNDTYVGGAGANNTQWVFGVDHG